MPKQMPEPNMKRLYPKSPEVRDFARIMRRKAQSAEPPMTFRSGAFNPPPAFVNLNRVPPFVALVLPGEHSVPSDFDFDWTLHKDKTIELRRRAERNRLVEEALLEGKTVAFRSSGNSLNPWVFSGDSCTYAPVTEPKELRLHDIVFCQVQPGDRYYAHIIKQIVERKGRLRFTLSDLKGRENGHCEMEHIYGKLIHVER